MPEMHMTVIDASGLHARPAARFVQTASRFTSRIVIRNGEREADAKSLIALLGLAVRLSSEITVAAEGCDAEEALASLAAELSPYVTQAGENHDEFADSVAEADR
jgi:phosphocarrier protein